MPEKITIYVSPELKKQLGILRAITGKPASQIAEVFLIAGIELVTRGELGQETSKAINEIREALKQWENKLVGGAE